VVEPRIDLVHVVEDSGERLSGAMQNPLGLSDRSLVSSLSDTIATRPRTTAPLLPQFSGVGTLWPAELVRTLDRLRCPLTASWASGTTRCFELGRVAPPKRALACLQPSQGSEPSGAYGDSAPGYV
jgi:hypothetical protein